MKEENDIEQLFRSSFEDFEVTPPAEVKSAIDKQLNGRRFRGGWLFIVLILLAFGTTLTFYFAGIKTASETENGTSVSGPDSGSGKLSGKDYAASRRAKRTAPDAIAVNASTTDRNVSQVENVNRRSTLEHQALTGKNGLTGKDVSRRAGKKSVVGDSPTGRRGKKTGRDYAPPAYGYSGDSRGELKSGELVSKVRKDTSSIASVPADSLKTEKADSTAAAAVTIPASVPTQPEQPSASGPKWMLSAFAGPDFGINSVKSQGAVKPTEQGSFLLSLELQRYFGDYAVSSGFSYGKRNDSFDSTTDSTSIYYVGIDSIPVYDQTGDSLLYYDLVPNYDTLNIHTSESRLESVTSFGIPLYIGHHFAFGSSNWGLLVNAGAVFNFHSVKYRSTDLDASVLTVTKFSVNGVLRAHATYQWKQLLFSAGVTGGLDFKPAVMLTGTDRKRYYFTPQVGVHWKF